MAKKLSSYTSPKKLAQRIEAKNAKRSFASKFKIKGFSTRSFASQF